MINLSWAEWVLMAGLISAVTAAACFVYHYSKLNWRATEYGKHIMYSAHAIGVTAVLAMIHETTGRTSWTFILLSVACAGVAGALFRQCRMVRPPTVAEKHRSLKNPDNERKH